MRMIFINLPVRDLKASKEFFTALGFDLDPEFSDDKAACLVIDQNIYIMLLAEERFRDFIVGEINDATTTTEVLTCLPIDSRKHVDETVTRAVAAGGRPWKPTLEEGPCTAEASRTPTGHV